MQQLFNRASIFHYLDENLTNFKKNLMENTKNYSLNSIKKDFETQLLNECIIIDSNPENLKITEKKHYYQDRIQFRTYTVTFDLNFQGSYRLFFIEPSQSSSHKPFGIIESRKEGFMSKKVLCCEIEGINSNSPEHLHNKVKDEINKIQTFLTTQTNDIKNFINTREQEVYNFYEKLLKKSDSDEKILNDLKNIFKNDLKI